MAVLWGTGFMGVLGQPLDIFNSPTPILILAVAAGHAVQLLKRYYEEYEALRAGGLTPKAANVEAACGRSVGGGAGDDDRRRRGGARVLLAGGVRHRHDPHLRHLHRHGHPERRGAGDDASSRRCARCCRRRRSATAARRAKERIWDRIPSRIADIVIPARPARDVRRHRGADRGVGIAMNRIVIDNSSKNFFGSWLDIQQDDDFLNSRIGGTNSLYIMVEGQGDDAIKKPEVLAAIESNPALRRGAALRRQDAVDRRFPQAHEPGDERRRSGLQHACPTTRNLISQYLFLYSISGDPATSIPTSTTTTAPPRWSSC